MPSGASCYLPTTSNCKTVCNISSYYDDWRNQPFCDPIAYDPSFWRYQSQPQFVLTKGLALDLAQTDCEDKIKDVTTFRAGRNGPISIQYSYKAMCSKFCVENDKLHQDAICYSGCSCLQLSNAAFQPGHFCKENSDRLLCDITGFCGIWNCRIDDFMCPRYEWNKKNIPLKGLGNCVKHSAAVKSDNFSFFISIALIVLMTLNGFRPIF